jgi:catechol 2,3-dioxygenase
METPPHARAGVSPRATLAADLRLGPVHLTVTDVDRSVAFYRDALGLRTHRREDRTAALGAGDGDLLVLVEERAARPPGRHAGLFHVALLHPSREELARAVARLGASATPIDGSADHGVSEAIYLSDPDGNGIELYADRPRERWPAPAPGERVGMFTRPLDLRGLAELVAGEQPPRHASEGLAVGHVHLHVGDLERGLLFYRDALGFEEMALLPGAVFVSAGGYHHHLGLNVWRGSDVPPAPPDAVGLRHWTIVLGDQADLAAAHERLLRAGVEAEDVDHGFLVRDPWEIAVQLVAQA